MYIYIYDVLIYYTIYIYLSLYIYIDRKIYIYIYTTMENDILNNGVYVVIPPAVLIIGNRYFIR